MNRQEIKRPWKKETRQGTRYNPNPKYQSPQWKNRRESFRNGHKIVNNVRVPNTMCLECYTKEGKLNPGKHTDHIIPVKAGGTDEDNNLQTLCDTCHARKSANEGKTFKK